MREQQIEPGISRLFDSTGRKIGYRVDGITRTFRTLRAARSALRRANRRLCWQAEEEAHSDLPRFLAWT